MRRLLPISLFLLFAPSLFAQQQPQLSLCQRKILPGDLDGLRGMMCHQFAKRLGTAMTQCPIKIPFLTISDSSLITCGDAFPNGSGTLKRISMVK